MSEYELSDNRMGFADNQHEFVDNSIRLLIMAWGR